jgi:hypothetical protein
MDPTGRPGSNPARSRTDQGIFQRTDGGVSRTRTQTSLREPANSRIRSVIESFRQKVKIPGHINLGFHSGSLQVGVQGQAEDLHSTSGGLMNLQLLQLRNGSGNAVPPFPRVSTVVQEVRSRNRRHSAATSKQCTAKHHQQDVAESP